ncbi:MAG: hypothetical protein MR011_01185 [Lachnospiraceae bacterium]|nr:hypothetical protein [Lachnospiraceae bacterium]
MDIAVTGYAGYEGSRSIYANKDYRDKLLNRYSESFFGVLKEDVYEYSSAERKGYDALYAKMSAEGLAADSGDGGVLSALWKVMKSAGCGGTYSLRDIPVMQQTIEVCEMFGLNPYRLRSPECRVWLMEDMGALQYEAAGASVPLRVIGFTTKGVAIKRTDTEQDSSLRRPEPDELYKLFPAK